MSVTSEVATHLKLKLLNRHQVLRYCNKPLKNSIDTFEVIPSGGAPVASRVAALHCFHPKAYGLGEQGSAKKESKQQFMSQLGFWVLKSNAIDLISAHTRGKSNKYVSAVADSTGSRSRKSRSKSILELVQDNQVPVDIWSLIRDTVKVNRLKSVWMQRDHTQDNEILSPFE